MQCCELLAQDVEAGFSRTLWRWGSSSEMYALRRLLRGCTIWEVYNAKNANISAHKNFPVYSGYDDEVISRNSPASYCDKGVAPPPPHRIPQSRWLLTAVMIIVESGWSRWLFVSLSTDNSYAPILATLKSLVPDLNVFCDLELSFHEYTGEEWYKNWDMYDCIFYTM